MKKYFSILTAVILAVLTMSLTACGDDNDEPENTNPKALIGTWESVLAQDLIEAMDGIWESGEQLFQFRSDGTAISVNYYVLSDYMAELEGHKEETDIQYCTWEAKGDMIYVVDEDGYTNQYKYTIKGDKLTLTLTKGIEIPVTFKRVSDSRINKYLD